MSKKRKPKSTSERSGPLPLASKKEKLRAIMIALDFDPDVPIPEKRIPKSPGDCKSIEDLVDLVFKRVHLDGSYQLLRDDSGRVIRWVWPGGEFTDKILKLVAIAIPHIKSKEHLSELRLVGTKISADGLRLLRQLFPATRVTFYTEADGSANWRLTQASYPES